MLIWENKIPSLLIKKSNIITTVLFTAVFALAFINIYSPFGVNIWFHITKLQLLFYSSLVILAGMLVIVISRIIMYYRCKKAIINYLQFSVWILVEVLSMGLFYTFFVKYALHDARDFLDIFKISIRNTTLVLFLPYSILWLYFAWRDKLEKLEKLSHTENYYSVSKKMIPFHDEKDKLRFSVKQEDLLYLEAADNYVTLYYNDKGKIARFLIRNTLKNFEEQLRSRNIIRCHRSYIVNFEKIKVIRKEKDGLHFELDLETPIDLPVSKTYVSDVIEAFSDNTPSE